MYVCLWFIFVNTIILLSVDHFRYNLKILILSSHESKNQNEHCLLLTNLQHGWKDFLSAFRFKFWSFCFLLYFSISSPYIVFCKDSNIFSSLPFLDADKRTFLLYISMSEVLKLIFNFCFVSYSSFDTVGILIAAFIFYYITIYVKVHKKNVLGLRLSSSTPSQFYLAGFFEGMK